MGMLHRYISRLVLIPFVFLALETQIVFAGFKDPLDEPAVIQKSFLDKPLIGSASNGSTVVVVGPRGLILYSDNTGGNWAQANVPVQSDLVAVQMISASQGWAVGHDGVILATSNGGVSWTKQLDGRSGGELFTAYYEKLLKDGEEVQMALELTELNFRDGPAFPYLDVWFKNEQTGYVVGGFGNIAKTEDGGKTWIPWAHRIDNDAGYHLNSVAGIGNDVFITSERGVIFRLDPKMDYFEPIETGYSGSFIGVVGVADRVIAYGLQGAAFVSEDGGDSWAAVEGLPASTINNVAVLAGDKTAVFANQAGELIVGDMQILQFEVIGSGEAVNFTSVVQVGRDDILATSLQGMYRLSLADNSIIKITAEE